MNPPALKVEFSQRDGCARNASMRIGSCHWRTPGARLMSGASTITRCVPTLQCHGQHQLNMPARPKRRTRQAYRVGNFHFRSVLISGVNPRTFPSDDKAGILLTRTPTKEHTMTNQIRPYEPLTSDNAASPRRSPGRPHDGRPRLFHRRTQTQCRCACQSRPGAQAADHCHDHGARQHVGADLPGTGRRAARHRIIDRSSVNAFDDARVARAIEATGRKKLIFAGIPRSLRRVSGHYRGRQGWTPMWRSTLAEHSAKPNARSAFCACCRPA